jgi:hypothetical protein
LPFIDAHAAGETQPVTVQRIQEVIQSLLQIRRSSRTTAPSSVGSTRVSIFAHSQGASRTIAGYETIHMIRKGQAYGSAADAKVGMPHRFIVSMFGIEA